MAWSVYKVRNVCLGMQQRKNQTPRNHSGHQVKRFPGINDCFTILVYYLTTRFREALRNGTEANHALVCTPP